jgi:ribonuclease HI
MIQLELCPNRLEIWTDGSLTREDGMSGYAFRIRGFENGLPSLIKSESGGLGSGTINQAELTALQKALQWTVHEYMGQRDRQIHIFTDSKYTLTSATCDATKIPSTNFFAIEEILNLGHRLRKIGMKPSIHFCPSHIERGMPNGATPLESTEVDKLANIGRMASSEVDERKHIKKVRDDILSASITLFNEINKKVEVLNEIETNGPSVVTDDFSACANADQERNLLL